MTDLQDTKHKMIRLEDVIAGTASSRLSSVIFFLLCGIPVFSTVLFGGVDNLTWIIIAVFWLAIILLWLTEAWRARGLIFDSSVLLLPMGGLILIGLIQLLPLGPGISGDLLSIPYSHSLSLDPYATRFFIGHLAVFFVFFAACLTFINTENRIKRVVLLVIIFGAAMAFVGILQRLADPEAIYGLRVPNQANPFGPFVNSHHFAAFMEMSGGVALGLLFDKKAAKDKKILLAIALVIMGLAIILTSSRGGMLSFGGVFAFVVFLNFATHKNSHESRSASDHPTGVRRKIFVAVSGVAITLGLLCVVLFLGGGASLSRGIGLTQMPEEISNGRTHFWSIAVKIFFEHPIIGAGLDGFGTAFSRLDTWNGTFRVEQAHNDYLQILADAGLVGFACVVIFIYFLFKKGLATISETNNNFRRSAAIGSLAGCFGILLHSFVDFPLRTSSNAFFFLLLAAVTTVSIKTSSDGEVSRDKKRRSSAP